MAAACPLLGDGLADYTLLHIARFLPTAKDLLCLCLTCPRFAAKIIAVPISSGGVGDGAAAAPEMLSIVEEAARQLMGCTKQERGWVPRRELESLLGLMHEVELLRVPPVFGRAHANFALSEGGAVATKAGTNGWRSAASMVGMRSGRHFVRFTVLAGGIIFFGVIRPGWGVEGDQCYR